MVWVRIFFPNLWWQYLFPDIQRRKLDFFACIVPHERFFCQCKHFFLPCKDFSSDEISLWDIYIYKKNISKTYKISRGHLPFTCHFVFSYKLVVALHITLYINKAIYLSNYGCRWSSLILNHSKKILFECLYQWRIQTLKYRKLLPPTHSSSAHSCIQTMILGGELAGDPQSQINFLGHSSLRLAL